MSLIFATFNTNSIRARLEIILGWLDQQRPDILCLQETKVQEKDFPLSAFEAAGYHAVFRGQKSYNGVAVISKYRPEKIRTDLYAGHDAEARFISAVIGQIPVINVYIPQGVAPGTEKFEYKLQWFKDLLSHIKDNYRPDLPLILTGDFNVALESIDVFDPERFRDQVCFHPDEQAAMKEILDWGLVDIFRKHQPDGGHFTFWDYRIPYALKHNMGWRIDYILASAPLAEKSRNSWIDTQPRALPKPSDHAFLVAEFNVAV